MAWQLLAMAAASIVQGISASNTAKKNAASARETAERNATIIQNTANYNADIYMKTAGAIEGIAGANAAAIEGFANYNADVIGMVANYNAQFNEMDARYTLDAAELDVDRTDREIYNLIGKNKTYYAGAGVRTNSGSPEDVEISTRTQGDIDIAIIRRGAQVEAQRFLDAAAMTRWQGSTDAATTRYQGELQGWQTRTQGSFDAGVMRDKAAMTSYEGEMNAMMTRINGASQASLYDSAATDALVGGFTSAATSYLGYKMMSANAAPVQPASIGTGNPALRTAALQNTQGWQDPSRYSLISDPKNKSSFSGSNYSLLGNFN